MKTRITRLLPGETVEFSVNRLTDLQEQVNASADNEPSLDLSKPHPITARVLREQGRLRNMPLSLSVSDIFTDNAMYDGRSGLDAAYHYGDVLEFRAMIGETLLQVSQDHPERKHIVRMSVSHAFQGEFLAPCEAIHTHARFFITRMR